MALKETAAGGETSRMIRAKLFPTLRMGLCVSAARSIAAAGVESVPVELVVLEALTERMAMLKLDDPQQRAESHATFARGGTVLAGQG